MTRPFIQQLTSVQAVYGGGVLVPHNFQAPNTGYFHVETVIDEGGDDSSATATIFAVQVMYSTDGANKLGADLVDVEGGYLLLWTYSGFLSTAAASATAWSLREGNASSTIVATVGDAPGTRIGDMVMEPDAIGVMPGTYSNWSSNRPGAGLESEWGMCHANVTTNLSQLFMGTLIVLPAQNAAGSLSISGSHIGKRDSEWYAIAGSPSSVLFDAQPAGDSNQSSSTTFIVDHGNENYLLIARSRLNALTTIGVRDLRITHNLDGVDINNVNTNVATAGATRTGRGFQYRLSADDVTRIRNTVFRVKNLSSGVHSFDITCNRHQATDSGETLDSVALLALRTSMLSQFTYDEHDQAIAVTSDVPTTGPWSVTITADGVTPIIIGFCTSSHIGNEGYVDLTLYRDSTLITADATGPGSSYGGFSNFRYVDYADGTDGGADSDNTTVPVTVFVADIPPVGQHTYTIKYARNSFSLASGGGGSTSSILNCNDNGASGFIGTLFAFEVKFATVF